MFALQCVHLHTLKVVSLSTILVYFSYAMLNMTKKLIRHKGTPEAQRTQSHSFVLRSSAPGPSGFKM